MLDRVLKIRDTSYFKPCYYGEGGHFHPTYHGWLPTRLILDEGKERKVIGEVEVVTAPEDGEVVLASEECRAKWGTWLKRYGL